MAHLLTVSRVAAQQAGQWFLQSGIQETNGGVARYHHSDTQKNAPVSTEITGYTVSAMLYLHGRVEEASFLEAAESAAHFLTEVAWDASLGVFPYEVTARSDGTAAPTYFFDTGIIIRGLLALWRKTGSDRLLAVARQAGLGLASDFAIDRRRPGAYHPILSLPSKAPFAHTSQWSRSPGCYQLKSALAWHELYRVTGESHFEDCYRACAAWSLSDQSQFLPAETPEKTMDRLHAYAYFLEGLLPLADQPEYRLVLSEGIDRISGYLRVIAPTFDRSDVYAQLLRLRVFAAQLPVGAMNIEAASEEVKEIESFQLKGIAGQLAVEGSFGFGRKAGAMLPFANPVSTAFCLQALEMWRDWEAGVRLELSDLI